MATITPTPGRQPALRGIPDVNALNYRVTPDDFGARGANDWVALGHAGQRDADAQMQYAGQLARTQANDAYAKKIAEMNSLGGQILSTTGENAANAEREMAEYSRMTAEKYSRDLSPLARSMFDNMQRDYDLNNLQSAQNHARRQGGVAYVNSLMAKNDALTNEAAAFVDTEGGYERFAGNVQLIKANTAEINNGQPAEVVAMRQREAVMLAVEGAASHLAMGPGGPAAALEFINSGIDAEIGDGPLKVKFDAMRKKYETAAHVAEDTSFAMDMARDPNITGAMIIEMAYARHPDEPQKANAIIGIADQYRAKKRDDENRLRVDERDEMWRRAAASNYDINSMDQDTLRSLMATDPDRVRSIVAFRDFMDKTQNKSIEPHYQWLYEKETMDPKELRAWLAEPAKPVDPADTSKGYRMSNFETLLFKSAGKQDLITRILNQAKKESGEAGSKGTPGAAKFNVGNWFQANYGGIFKSFWGGKSVYDPSGATDKTRNNAFEVIFLSRQAEMENEKGGALTFKEMESLAEDLGREVRANPDMLQSTFFDEDEKQPTAPEVKSAATPEDKAVYSGNDVVEIPAIGGAITRFGVLDTNSHNANNGIPASLSALNPKSAMVALDDGEIDYGNNGTLPFSRNDRIVDDGAGTISVFDGRWREKAKVEISTVSSGPVSGKDGPPYPIPDFMDPGMEKYIHDMKEKYKERAQYNWNKAANEWVVSSPEGIHVYNVNGVLIYSELSPTGGLIDTSL